MSDIAIKVENLSKRYRIGLKEQMHDTLGAALASWLKSPFLNFNRLRKLSGFDPKDNGEDIIWALKDVSFEVKEGEALGIIGRNGAGKSTLLKILSRITEPTTGKVTIKGRVSSLLEVGTGFHQELTGRENIYLNGTTLGMSKAEVDTKLEEIVAFSEIEKFIDTPVKRYSSGMRVRLAFAVAAHLEPEILLIDEVLAVGDAAFQKKCLGKMENVTRKGRTVLFVSHNMATIISLCGRALLLKDGNITNSGYTNDVVIDYMSMINGSSQTPLHSRPDRGGDGSVLLSSIYVDNGSETSPIRCSDSLHFKIDYRSMKALRKPRFSLGIYDQLNRSVYRLDSDIAGGLPSSLPPTGSISCTTSPVNLAPGKFIVSVAVFTGGTLRDHLTGATTFEVQVEDFYGTGKITSSGQALYLLRQVWKEER
jgi:lipopolysaccharide transport system ATP-binding protein